MASGKDRRKAELDRTRRTAAGRDDQLVAHPYGADARVQSRRAHGVDFARLAGMDGRRGPGRRRRSASCTRWPRRNRGRCLPASGARADRSPNRREDAGSEEGLDVDPCTGTSDGKTGGDGAVLPGVPRSGPDTLLPAVVAVRVAHHMRRTRRKARRQVPGVRLRSAPPPPGREGASRGVLRSLRGRSARGQGVSLEPGRVVVPGNGGPGGPER